VHSLAVSTLPTYTLLVSGPSEAKDDAADRKRERETAETAEAGSTAKAARTDDSATADKMEENIICGKDSTPGE